MSFYTDVILYTGGCFTKKEERWLDEKINQFFWDEEFGECSQHGFASLDKLTGVWVGSLRNIDVEALVEHLMNIDWGELKYPTQLMVKGEDDDRFKIIDVF